MEEKRKGEEERWLRGGKRRDRSEKYLELRMTTKRDIMDREKGRDKNKTEEI